MIIMVVHDFNSRSLPGERFLRLSIRIYQSIFQFLLPAWGATCMISCTILALIFQFSLPAWGAMEKMATLKAFDEFQFSLPALGAIFSIAPKI